LTKMQLAKVDRLFDAVCSEPLRPLHELDQDENRHMLDKEFMVDVLGLPRDLHEPSGPMQLLRMKLAREPSIVGSKKAD
jgi:hypothetical protein